MKAKTFKKVEIMPIINHDPKVQVQLTDIFEVTSNHIKLDTDWRVRDNNEHIVIFNEHVNTDGHGWIRKNIFSNLKIHQPVSKDLSFYRHKKITLPRDKFNLLKDKYNWSITRNKDKADYHIISESLLEEGIVHYTYQNRGMRNEEFKNFIMQAYDRNFISDRSRDSLLSAYKPEEDILYSLNSYGPWHRYRHICSMSMQRKLNDTTEGLSNLIDKAEENKTYSVGDGGLTEIYYTDTAVKVKNKDAFDSVFNNTTTLFVWDHHLVNITNEDNPVLGEDEFQMILDLITSNNIDDINMGVNVLANCNIKKSLGIVAYFYAFYHDHLASSSNWSSIIVKSMRAHIKDVDRIAGRMGGHSWTYDWLIRYLARNNSLTEFIFNKISTDVFNKFTKQFFGEDTVFEIPKIKLNDKLKSAIKMSMPDSSVEVDLRVEKKVDLPF